MSSMDEGSVKGLTPAGVLESSLYCSDLEAAERFYRDVIGLGLIGKRPGRHVFLRCGQGMVLLFDPDATADAGTSGATGGGDAPGGGIEVPSHGARGPGHLAFRVPDEELDRWRSHLREAGVPIEAEVRWPGGGRSIYVRDPAGNSIELATAAVWGFAPCRS